jgi:hypothetical protein
MTIQEFFEALTTARAAGYRAYLVAMPYGQAVRLTSPTGHEHCPITAVYEHQTGQTFSPAAVYSTHASLGLSADDAYALTAAADLQGTEPMLRHQLLTALALWESPERPGAGPSTPRWP